MPRKLTERQKKFIDFYVETGNGTQSYIDAGYGATSRSVAEANARKLLATNSVRKRIDELISNKDEKRIAKQDEVLEYLTSVMRGEIKEESIVVVSKGDFVSEAQKVKKQVGPKDRNKAAELLGKRYRLFTDRIEHEGLAPVTIVDDIEEDGQDEG